MPTYIIFANTDDGWLQSDSASYATAVAGGGTTTIDNTSSFFKIGQNLVGGPDYAVFEGFLNFDTSSIATSEKVIEAMVKLTVNANVGVVNYNDIDIRLLTWNSPLTTAQWKNPNTVVLPAPQFGAQYGVNLGAQTPVQCSTGFNRPGEMINKGGATRFVVGTANSLLAIQPSGSEYLQLDSSNIGTSADPTLVVITSKRDTMRIVNKCNAQLSTGDTVVVVSDGADPTPALTLGYYAKGTTAFTAIASLPVGTSLNQISPQGGNFALDLVVDPFDNIYVVGVSGGSRNTWWGQAFAKGAGLTWTAKTVLTFGNANGETIQSLSATFVTNTANSGYVWVVAFPEVTTWHNPSDNLGFDGVYAVMNATRMLAGVAALVDTQQTLGYYGFCPSSPFDGTMRAIDTNQYTQKQVDNSLIATAYMFRASSSAAMQVAWNVLKFNSGGGGVQQFNGSISISTGGSQSSLSDGSMVKLIQLDGSRMAICFGHDATHHDVILVDSSGNGNIYNAINFATMPDFSTSADWDATYDPAGGNLWFYYIDPTNNRRIARHSFNINSQQWSSSESAVTTTLGSAGGTNSKLRTTDATVNNLNIIVEAASVTSGGVWSTSAVLDSFNNVPNAPVVAYISPFDAGTAKQINWIFSDPDSGDSQSAYAVEIDNNSTGASAYRSGTVASAANNFTLAASALTNGITYRIRISNKDVNGGQGPFSGYSTFQTSSVGTLTITDPASDNPAGQTVANYTVHWTYTNTGGATQTKYQLNMVRISDGVQLYSSGLQTSTATSAIVYNIPTGVPVRFDLVITNNLSQVTPTASRLFTTNYATPDQITSLNAVSGYSSVALTWAIPTPTGSKPYASTYDIYRSADGGITWTLVDNVPAGTTSYTDLVVPSQCTPIYTIRSNAANGYTWSVQATANASISFLGIIINQQDQTGAWTTSQSMFFGGPQNVETIAIGATQLQFAGRTYPVSEFGDTQTDSIAVQATLAFAGNPSQFIGDTNTMTDLQIRQAMNDIANNRSTVCFRDGRGRQVFGAISNLSYADDILGTKFSFTVDAVDFIEGLVTTNVTS